MLRQAGGVGVAPQVVDAVSNPSGRADVMCGRDVIGIGEIQPVGPTGLQITDLQRGLTGQWWDNILAAWGRRSGGGGCLGSERSLEFGRRGASGWAWWTGARIGSEGRKGAWSGEGSGPAGGGMSGLARWGGEVIWALAWAARQLGDQCGLAREEEGNWASAIWRGRLAQEEKEVGWL